MEVLEQRIQEAQSGLPGKLQRPIEVEMEEEEEMANHPYAIAYKEVLEILKYISKEDYNKIPEKTIRAFEENADKNYQVSYNPNMTLVEQNISRKGRAVIAVLYRDYWASPEQREKILQKQRIERWRAEEEKRKMYNPDDLFKRNKKW